MSVYSSIRFKGIVKKEYRSTFKDIALNGKWEIYAFQPFLNYIENDRYSRIPCGFIGCVPKSWEDEYGNATDGFETQWNEDTGYWAFQCSLNKGDDVIDDFIDILPELMETIEHCEVMCELWTNSVFYDINKYGAIILDKTIKYYDSIF